MDRFWVVLGVLGIFDFRGKGLTNEADFLYRDFDCKGAGGPGGGGTFCPGSDMTLSRICH